MLSILPVKTDVNGGRAGMLERVSAASTHVLATPNVVSSEVYEIIVIDRAADDASVPARAIRNVTPPPRRPRSGRRLAVLTVAAAALCAASGFAAAVLFGNVPAPRAPQAPERLSSVRSWLASYPPVRVQPLAMGGGASVTTPQLAGWVAGSDAGSRGLKVELLPGKGPYRTLAIQLPTEPRMAMIRGVSARAVDIEIAAIGGRGHPQDLSAASETFVRHVSVRKPAASEATGLVRVRVNLDVPAQANVRVDGRTVYADFAVRPTAS